MFSTDNLPPDLATLLADATPRDRQTGRLGAEIVQWVHPQQGSLYLKVAPHGAGEDFLAEARRLRWLAGKLPVPNIVYLNTVDDTDYLLISGVPGKVAHDPAWQTDPARLMRLLAEGLHRIHALPTEDCPFNTILADELAEAERRIREQVLDRDAFLAHAENRTPETVLASLHERVTLIDDEVFTHGDFCLPNILITDWNIAGYIDWAIAGLADRHRDLMCIVDTVEHNLGESWVPVFFEAYGVAVNWDKIRFYQDLDLFY